MLEIKTHSWSNNKNNKADGNENLNDNNEDKQCDNNENKNNTPNQPEITL